MANDDTSAEVRAARVRLGLTLAAFAKRLGVSPRAVQYWEAGTRKPGAAALTLIRRLRKAKGR